MATLTKSTGTVTLSGSAEKVTLPSVYGWVWIKNMSESDIFAGLSADISEGADGVMVIPAGECGRIQTDGQDSVYLMGTGNALVVAQNYADCPFKLGGKGGGADVGGESSYVLKNAVDYPLLGLNLYGKSTQDGVPTPDTPVDIVSVGDSGTVNITSNNGGEIAVTAAITSSLPLCGIPVSAGGNYTDSNGQQWVCDELVYNADGTGKVVKRTAKVVFDGSDDEKWVTTPTLSSSNGTSNKIRFRTLMFRENENLNLKPIKPLTTETLPKLICDRYATKSSTSTYCNNTGICVDATSADIVIYDDDYAESTVDEWKSYLAANPVTVVYQLETPQEIELTAAEMTALRELQTFNGITNITNDSGADMDITYCTNKTMSEYVFPITTGLQSQIDELKAAVLSLGGNI